MSNLNANLTIEQAHELLAKYNKEPFHIQHAETVSSAMAYFAKELGYEGEEEFWRIVGLLHDIVFEMWPE